MAVPRELLRRLCDSKLRGETVGKRDNENDRDAIKKMRKIQSKVDRRQFLTMLGLTAASGTYAGSIGRAQAQTDAAGRPGPTASVTETEALIIGSGFGGSVAALRLGQAGIRTIVLERGQRWAPVPGTDTFARTAEDQRSTYLGTTAAIPFGPPIPVTRFAGVTEKRDFPNMSVITGAGVGGGSLVYGTTTIAPIRALFQKVFPKSLDYDELAAVYYPRVRAMLHASQIPTDIYNSDPWRYARAFAAQATAAGFDPKFIDAATDWTVARKELAGTLPKEITIGNTAGGGAFGSNNGAKFSLDRNYLPAAEATGKVQILPLHSAVDISRSNGRFQVKVNVIDLQGNVVSTKTFVSKYLFLAAGSVGTTRLLLRAKATNGLSSLNNTLGSGFGTNGKSLFIRIAPTTFVGSEQGLTPANSFYDLNNSVAPAGVESAPSAIGAQVPVSLQSTALVVVPERGVLRYDAAANDVALDWGATASQRAVNAAKAVANTLNAANPGSQTFTQPVLGPDGFSSGFTYHPLGGVVMGQTADIYGRVKGQSRLYVMDGSLLPGSCAGANPSFTIAALAERNIERIIDDDCD
jgi:cholesterol oxidase